MLTQAYIPQDTDLRIIAINDTDVDHLDDVTASMRTLGAPDILAVDMRDLYGAWVALEGSHRLAAASLLGLRPNIIPVDYSDDTLADAGVVDDSADDFTVAEICDDAYSRAHLEYVFPPADAD